MRGLDLATRARRFVHDAVACDIEAVVDAKIGNDLVGFLPVVFGEFSNHTSARCAVLGQLVEHDRGACEVPRCLKPRFGHRRRLGIVPVLLQEIERRVALHDPALAKVVGVTALHPCNALKVVVVILALAVRVFELERLLFVTLVALDACDRTRVCPLNIIEPWRAGIVGFHGLYAGAEENEQRLDGHVKVTLSYPPRELANQVVPFARISEGLALAQRRRCFLQVVVIGDAPKLCLDLADDGASRAVALLADGLAHVFDVGGQVINRDPLALEVKRACVFKVERRRQVVQAARVFCAWVVDPADQHVQT